MPKKPRVNCFNCGKEVNGPTYKFCSSKCSSDYRYKQYIEQWITGVVSGLQGHGVVSKHVKRYLREKFDNRCMVCGWSEVNIFTGLVPLVADHIDGDWRNNVESNLRLICPNCDSLTTTYAGLNRGNGRERRALSKRAQESRLLINVPE